MFRFTIRDVLWLMVVAGLGAGWWADPENAKSVINEQSEMLQLWGEYFRANTDEHRAAIRDKMRDTTASAKTTASPPAPN